jgi:hypothetical protein
MYLNFKTPGFVYSDKLAKNQEEIVPEIILAFHIGSAWE